MSYTAICEALKDERMAANHHDSEQARAEWGVKFVPAFRYRRGSKLFVMNKESAIAKHYRTLHGPQTAGKSLPLDRPFVA